MDWRIIPIIHAATFLVQLHSYLVKRMMAVRFFFSSHIKTHPHLAGPSHCYSHPGSNSAAHPSSAGWSPGSSPGSSCLAEVHLIPIPGAHLQNHRLGHHHHGHLHDQLNLHHDHRHHEVLPFCTQPATEFFQHHWRTNKLLATDYCIQCKCQPQHQRITAVLQNYSHHPKKVQPESWSTIMEGEKSLLQHIHSLVC